MTQNTDRTEYDAQWFCGDCATGYVVPSLARDCEARHAALLELVS